MCDYEYDFQYLVFFNSYPHCLKNKFNKQTMEENIIHDVSVIRN